MTSFWSTQSLITNPGKDAQILAAIDSFPSDISSLRAIASEFCLHYRVFESDVLPSRKDEIHTRYADEMFPRILSRGQPLNRKRSPDQRTVGCCRDSTVLLVSMLRQKGIPARVRIGSSAYFHESYMIDHVVAEVWDANENRWRMFDPDVPTSLVKFVQGKKVDWNDLRPGIDFQTAAEAWTAARSGSIDPNKYIIAPGVDIKGLPYIAVNVIHDLAAMNKQEMLLWDSWGVQNQMDEAVPEDKIPLVDEIAKLLLDRDVQPGQIQALIARKELAVPDTVLRFDPNAPGQPPKPVSVRQAVQ